VKDDSTNLVPYTIEEFGQMIDKAFEDSQNDKLRSVHELKEDIKSWD
jgi:hypothetical protein